MAYSMIEGFDTVGDNSALTSRGWSRTDGTIGAATGRFGGAGYALSGTSQWLQFYEVVAGERYTSMSFWFKASVLFNGPLAWMADRSNTSGAGHPLISLTDIGVVTLALEAGSVVFSSSQLVSAGTWCHIELLMHHSNAGKFQLYVDGFLQYENISVDNADYNSNGEYWFNFKGNAAGVLTLDDIVIQRDIAAYPVKLGLHRIHTLLPDGVGTNTGMTAGTGNTFAEINDPLGATHDGDTSYIAGGSVGNKSDFTMENITEMPSTIHAVQTNVVVRKTDAGTVGVTPYIDSNTAIASGTETGASESYVVKKDVFETDPDTTAPFTASGLNALKVGIEITT